ncbi:MULTISPECIES: hypothetical protein [Clostridium]|uniref:Uncharacterized protein n=3 Tax=Clostridium TaxID=1485 RepID=A0A162LAR6_9CLOT|nr:MULTISPECIES: hypothetical protein [Clostridium]AGY77161.1 hypothetical protein CAETHG_2956 [Clostridium autoethanogenum DSM 10061]ALU37302.1 Hypothetical protein CLAU_2875 [Clostridium autoethanogenum DSM 10061]OAA93562.1 hypothetical protein WX73_04058 [Clostridium coskatii]OBR94463.1 hypothetical protein CLCOS_19620 [Clostridium coskatii]OVY50130.1 hypothetical protein WX72_02890 [Clostridium autoethanogenum]
MKKLKRIIVWTMIPIVMELAGLLLVDKFYFGGDSNFNIKKVDTTSKQTANKISVKIPEDAKMVKVSYSGNYISYYDGQSLQVIDTLKNSKKEVDLQNDLSYYTWNLDTDNILVAEKTSGGSESRNLKFETYDAKRDSTYPLKNEEKKQELSILLPDNSYDVKHIAFSGASNVIYVSSATNEEGSSRIYRIDVMIRMNLVNFVRCQLGNMAAINGTNGDELIYEDRTSNRIRTSRGGIIATGENAMHYLLNTDNNDNIYIGNGEDNKVNKIFVANLKTNKSSWKEYTLPSSVNKNNIYVTRSGNIYINDSKDSQVKDITTGKVTKYSGNFVSVYKYGVISQDGKKLTNSLF